MGIREDGTVVAAEENNKERCDVSGWRNIIAVAATDHHTTGLRSDGTVVAVGDNYNGACDVKDWGDIISIEAYNHATYGVRADGTVVSTNSYDSNKMYDWNGVIAFSAGSDGTLFGLRYDGTVLTTFREKYSYKEIKALPWKLFVNYTFANPEYAECIKQMCSNLLTALQKKTASLQKELSSLWNPFGSKRRRDLDARMIDLNSQIQEITKCLTSFE